MADTSELKLETAPADKRVPMQNQAKACYMCALLHCWPIPVLSPFPRPFFPSPILAWDFWIFPASSCPQQHSGAWAHTADTAQEDTVQIVSP